MNPEDFQKFQHRAMATTFEIMIAGEDRTFAGGAAQAGFEEIDRLEAELSRFTNSDISRLNNLPPGQSVKLGWDAFQCLVLSELYSRETGGAFDVTLGYLEECWIGKDRTLLHPSDDDVRRAAERTGMGLLELDESTMSVRVGAATPLVDLGAVGKGYAVDRVVELLKEWGVTSALVHGGTSSVYAFGKTGEFSGWPVTLSDPRRPEEVLEKIVLAEAGLGGSGIRKGRHIIDPRRLRPVEGRRAAWVLAESAARSDALSTACMVMEEDEIRAMVSGDGRLRAVIVGEDGVRRFRMGADEPV